MYMDQPVREDGYLSNYLCYSFISSIHCYNYLFCISLYHYHHHHTIIFITINLETTIWSSSFRIPSDKAVVASYVTSGVPVGHPISATTFYLVTEDGKEVTASDGEGEIHKYDGNVDSKYINGMMSSTASSVLPPPSSS